MKLAALIELYIRHQQALGKKFVTEARILRAFGRRFRRCRRIETITSDEVASFLVGTRLTTSYHHKYRTLDRFFRRALSRGHVEENPLPKLIPNRLPGLRPYIYSRDEIGRLLAATDEYQILRSTIEPVTIRVLILLLYGTGLRIGEARRLNRGDVALDQSLVTVHTTKFYKSRLVPICAALTGTLKKYLKRAAARCSGTEPSPLLTTRLGTRLKTATVNGIFRRVCRKAGIHRSDGGRYQPRLHDLRHAFAVHRLMQWYHAGADVQVLLPHLSVYLGHVSLASTQVYLSMTPELLQAASNRFESYAFPEIPHG